MVTLYFLMTITALLVLFTLFLIVCTLHCVHTNNEGSAIITGIITFFFLVATGAAIEETIKLGKHVENLEQGIKAQQFLESK